MGLQEVNVPGPDLKCKRRLLQNAFRWRMGRQAHAVSQVPHDPPGYTLVVAGNGGRRHPLELLRRWRRVGPHPPFGHCELPRLP